MGDPYQLTAGPIVLFGSGETSPSGRKIFDSIFQSLPLGPQVALLETPAGFELNSAQVIGRIGDFLDHRLQNYQPQIRVVSARKRGTPDSPDEPQVVEPLFSADMIFMGPGSPSYAVRQLTDSLAWNAILARHRLGAVIALASAAVVAISTYALPVYEIYKVGEDIHWKPGLDLFGHYGLPLVFVPHWNNNDGGEELDTSRCFMGKERFTLLMQMLPAELTVVGIDEKTGLIIYPQSGTCKVVGLGGVTLIHTGESHQDSFDERELEGTGLAEVAQFRQGHVHQFRNSESFSLSRIGGFHQPEPGMGLPASVWEKAVQSLQEEEKALPSPPEIVYQMLQDREAARQSRNWPEADRLRNEIASYGWQVLDTPDGPRLELAA
jgi:hypothetical protein